MAISTFRIKANCTHDDLLRSYRLYVTSVFHRSWAIRAIVTLIVVCAGLLLLLGSVRFGGAFLAFAVFYWFAVPELSLLGYRKYIKTLRPQFVFTSTPQKISIANVTKSAKSNISSEVTSNWKALIAVIEDRHTFCLLLHPRIYVLLPKRFFASEYELTALRDYAKAKLAAKHA